MEKYRVIEGNVPVADVRKVVDELEEQIEDLQGTIARIRAWCEAYPIDMFPDQDLKKADEVLKAAGISMSAMHGQWARHIMQGVARIVGAAPEPERPADIPKQAD